jgi:membrane protein DedA with SNARE-associated domain
MFEWIHHPLLHDMLATYGPWAVMFVVMLESAGMPLPGETMVVTAALYAGATGRVSIYWVVLAAASGAIVGDNIGYWVGRELGLPLLVKYGPRIHLTERRLRLGQYLFLRFGSSIVFFGRFVALLRTFAALLAGANHFHWEKFLLFNAMGGICWASIFGFGAYWLGQRFEEIKGPIGYIALAGALFGVIALTLFLRHHEERLLLEAEEALPGPLRTK